MSAFSTSYSHRSLTLIHVPRFLRANGLHAASILRESGIPPAQLGDPEAWFDRDVCFALEERVAKLTGLPLYGPSIASHYELPQLGWWGKSIAQSPNLIAALRFAVRTVDTLQRGTELSLTQNRRSLDLDFRYLGRGSVDPIQHVLGTLVVLRKIGLMTGIPDAISVKIARPHSAIFAELPNYLGVSLEFDCDCDGVRFDNDILHETLSGHPPLPTPFMETTHDAIALIAGMLPYEVPTRERIAQRLKMSGRTLQRRLNDWGITFEEIVDEYRRERAVKQITRSDRSILEIAYSLGYSDSSHFTRAFRRWTGLSPKAFRTGHRAGLIGDGFLDLAPDDSAMSDSQAS